MDQNVVECESEKECACKSGATLDILRDVQRAYEDRLQVVERLGGAEKMQMQVRVFRSWVSDLVAQNALLVRAVEELERETTARAEAERIRHAEMECELRVEAAVLRRQLARKDSDLRGLIEVLRRLREYDLCSLDGIHFFDVTESDIFGSDGWLRATFEKGYEGKERISTNGGVDRDNRMLELSLINESLQKDVAAKDREIRRLNKDLQQYEQTMARMRDDMSPHVPRKDVEQHQAGMCCTGTECGDLVPVKDVGEQLREETSKYRERIQNMETSLKSSSVKLRTVHKLNISLIEELKSLRRVCIALEMERRDLQLKLDLEEQIVMQMVRQLRQAKAKDHVHVVTSTPDGTQVLPDEAEISIIPPQLQSHVTISDEDLHEDSVVWELCKCGADDVYEQTTLKLDTPDRTQSSLDQSQKLHTESRVRNESGKYHLDTSCSPLNQYRNIKTDSSPRNLSGNLRITSQSILDQDTSLVTESSPVDPNDNKKPTSCQSPSCLHKYVLPIARNRELSESIQPDLSQNTQIESANLVSEQISRNQSDQQKRVLSQSLLELNIPEAKHRERTVSLQPESSISDQNQSSNIISSDVKPASNQSQSRYNITDARPRKRSVSLQHNSVQSTNIIYEHSSKNELDDQMTASIPIYLNHRYRSKDLLVEVNQDRSQNSRNNSFNPLSDHTKAENHNENPGEQSQSLLNRSLELDQSQPRSKESKSTEEIRKKSEINDKITLEKCLCKCHCQITLHHQATKTDTPKNMSSEHIPTEMNSMPESYNGKTSSKSENAKKESAEECQCKCFCGNSSYDPTLLLDSQNYTSSMHLPKPSTSKCQIAKKTSSKTENVDSADECQCKCLCQNTSYDPTSLSHSQNSTSSMHLPKSSTSNSQTAKVTSSKTENVNLSSAEECQCKCLCQNTLYEPTTISNSKSCMSLEHLPKATTSKKYKERASSKPENDKEKSAEECQCKYICDQTKPIDKSTVSDHQRWLITPDGIMKALEALKQTFLGKSEDYTSIWIRRIADRTPCSLNQNIQADTSSVLPNPSPETRRKKSVSILEPIRSTKCLYCGASIVSCEEYSDMGVSPKMDRGTQKPEKTDRSQGPQSIFIVENVEQKIPAIMKWEPTEDNEATEKTASSSRRMLRAKLLVKDSVQDSGGSSCAGACEQYYRDKLLATLQILENKEETIRVQGSSLAVAGDRITELTKRATELRQELDNKARELNQLRQIADSRVDHKDVCVSAEMKDAEDRKHLVETLEDNLSTVIELYRECFYETAKQEELIDMLRKSYLDVRLMEKDKAEKITRLENVINTQKRSIEQCQDVVLEVESLKSEISSFLNSSNNDSGMWERGSESPDVGEELADILDQLRQLQQMLTSDCTCGLEEECSSLKERNRVLEVALEKQRQRNEELDGALRQILDQQYEKQIKEKEREFQEVVKKLADAENTCKERSETCETLTRQLQQARVLLTDKTAELVEAQQSREAQNSTIRRLQQDLDKSEQLVKEGQKTISEVAQSRTELLLECHARISELEQQLLQASRRCRELKEGCRERQASLAEAQARGARLCAESRRVTAGVKQWMREKRQLAREQQEKIKMQKLRIRELERCVGARQNFSELTSQSETDPCSSNTQEYRLTCDTRYPRCSRLNPTCRSETTTLPRGSLAGRIERERENETARCSKCTFNRQESASEMASCSQAPVPPRRKKRQSSDDINHHPTAQVSRERFDCSGHPDIRWSRLYSRIRQASPTEVVLERVEHLPAALAAGQRRWGRPRR